MSKKPKVSIVAISYNQQKYIKQALDSFVMQKTDFDFEIVIADDCSTDNTAKIIKEYEQKYPKLFKPILRKKNIGIQPNLIGALQAAKGEYIALCEGDDYWTSDVKLQTQADFLDKNPNHALCFHLVREIVEGEQKETIFPDMSKKTNFDLEGLLKRNFIQTNSVMYRRQKYDNIPENILPLDWFLHLYHAQFGKIGFVNEVMSVYRRHPGGVWWQAHNDKEKFWAIHGMNHLVFFTEVQKMLGDTEARNRTISENIFDTFNALVAFGGKDKKTLRQAMKEYPESAVNFLVNQYHALEIKEQQITSLQQALHAQEQLVQEKREELNMIKSSKVWRARNTVARATRRKVIE